MKFDIVTIFPRILDSYFQEAQIKRAVAKKLIEVETHDLRDYAEDKHRTTDDIPYGGGAGMVMKVEPIFKNVRAILKKSRFKRKEIRVIMLSAKGKIFDQKKARALAQKYKQLVLICGRYEGVDQRVAEHIADEEIAVGPYVLSGGELGAAIIVDSITRLVPGVVGNESSLVEESYENETLEYPQYTRPEMFEGWKVPEILLSGDHGKIKKWREQKQNRIK